MTIASMDALIEALIGLPQLFGKDSDTAEAAGIMHTPWYNTGPLGAGAAPGGGLNGNTFTATAGAFTGAVRMPAAVPGERCYLAGLDVCHAGGIGELWLIDRIWGNVPVVTTTGNQAVASPAWPNRDGAGGNAGDRIYLALEVSAATGNGAPVTTITAGYTNSAGVAGRTATCPSFPATAAKGTFLPLSLQAGDNGVRAVSGYNQGGATLTSGQDHLIAFRLIARIPTPAAFVSNYKDFTALRLPQVFDDSVLQLVYMPTATAIGALSGALDFAQG